MLFSRLPHALSILPLAYAPAVSADHADGESGFLYFLPSIDLLIIFSVIGLIALYRQFKKPSATPKAAKVDSNLSAILSEALNHSGASMAITNRVGQIEYANKAFYTNLGFGSEDLIGKSIDIIAPIHSAEHATFGIDCLKENWSGEVLCARKDHSLVWNTLTVSAIRDAKGFVTNYVISAINVSDLKAANQEMETLALFDPLTGLANRRLFEDRLDIALSNLKRHNNSVALLYLDLDKFKQINDTLGHQAGDELLVTVAKRIKSCVREQDTVARLGGDEFTVMLNNLSEIDKIRAIAKSILNALKKPIKLGSNEVIISTSIGISIAPNDSKCSETLMKNADLALYRAKENGRDCYHFFTRELNVRANRLVQIENDLREAIENDQLHLVYQPQINLQTGEVSSIEALLRWTHPEKGPIKPADFLGVAEETGMILDIGYWVIRTAVKDIKHIIEKTGKNLRVSVNLSTRQLTDKSLAYQIEQILNDHNLGAEHLELELTEESIMKKGTDLVAQLCSLKECGVTITIDDYGSGYSSLNYLNQLPVNLLKIDQRFVEKIPHDLHAMEVASAVVAIAHKLGLKVIAEGVENIDQRDYLMINGCDFAQGYYFSRPMTQDNLIQILSDDEGSDEPEAIGF